MAKKDKKVDYDKQIVTENIGDLCTKYMQLYGANNNLMRHVPFLMDGLKPGERRILYTLYKIAKERGIKYYSKVSKVKGATSDFHPHGPDPIYKTIVKMAEEWTNNQCLIKGRGNFGSPNGDVAAADRYITCRISDYAYKCFFEEFDPQYVDMAINYTGTELEPVCLPSRYPNVLINDTYGIGFGILCSVPTYNLKEVFELTIKLIDDPTTDCTLIPDNPRGYEIIDEGKYPEISETGKGVLKMRGRVEIDEKRNAIVIYSTPTHVNMRMIEKKVLDLYKDGFLPGFKKISDESEGINAKMVLFFKDDIDLISIKHLLYKKTKLQNSLPINFILIDELEVIEFNIRDILLSWIEYRRDTKRRFLNHKFIKAKERQHILETLLFILNKDNAEKTLKIIRQAENKKEIVEALMDKYSITSLQANNIASMSLTAFSKDSKRKYKEEKEELDKEVEKTFKILCSDKKIDKIIKDELKEGIILFGKERQCPVVTIDGEVKVTDSEHVLVFTNNGKVKKLPGVVDNVGEIDNNDFPTEVFHTRNTAELLLFDINGKVTKLPVHKIQQCDINSTGIPLNKICKVSKIVSIIPNPNMEELEKLPDTTYFIMISEKGIIKKTNVASFMNIKNELMGMVIKDGDRLQAVKVVVGDKDMLIYTSKGLGLAFNSSEIKETNRLSIGIKALPMTDDEKVIGMDLLSSSDRYFFALTSKGNGKKSPMDTFKISERNAKPQRIISLNDGEEIIKINTVFGDEMYRVFLKGSVETINLKDVIELPRLSKGRKLIPVRKGEHIIDVRKVQK